MARTFDGAARDLRGLQCHHLLVVRMSILWVGSCMHFVFFVVIVALTIFVVLLDSNSAMAVAAAGH